MDLRVPEQEKAFRDEVRTFLEESLTPEIREAGRLVTSVFAPVKEAMAWQRILNDKGWAAPHWPKEFGGTGWSVSQRAIFAEELVRAETPPLVPMGLHMCGPCLIGCGTEEQQQEYLPKILNGEHFWCQGYSEPGSGSDLASLKTFADKDGDDYILNGTKIWTTYAHYANKMSALVRTNRDGKPQQGITFLLLDMGLPGMEVRPILGLDGAPEQCEVFFSDVRVPCGNRVGEENEGWTVAKYVLEFERGGSTMGAWLVPAVERLREQCEQVDELGQRRLDDPVLARRLEALEIDALAVEHTEKRVNAGLKHGQNPGPMASLLKILGTEVMQRFSELQLEVTGLRSLVYDPDALEIGAAPSDFSEDELLAMPYYMNTRAASIYAGSNEVQRSLLAKAVMAG